MGFFTGCARLLLITFNFIFWLSGAAILGVGIWILVDPNMKQYMDVVKDASNDDEFLKTAAYILIGFGAFVFIVGFSGCCGAIRSSKCLLGFYIFFLVIVFAGELAAGIYVAVFRSDINSKLDTGLTNSIRDNYKDKLTKAWDSVQTELKCCGGNSYKDYENSSWAEESVDNVIPASCCTLNATGQPENLDGCKKLQGGTYYVKGCKDALEDWINSHSAILIGVGCGIAALEIFGLICAICFCRSIDREKYESS